LGKAETGLCVLLVALHVLTLATPRPGDDEEDEYVAPAPPGPGTE
jgi:hypothetical protein